MKVRPVEAELFHVDRRAERDFGRTSMMKLIATFHSFENSPLKACLDVLFFGQKSNRSTPEHKSKAIPPATTCSLPMYHTQQATACI
jgi:hypothetical protein